MFSKSKARRSEAQRASTLAQFEQLADHERGSFAYELILTRDHDLALHLLLRMLDTEVSPPVRASVVESLDTALRNARRLLTEVEDDVLKEGASSPAALLTAWNAWRQTLASRVDQAYEQPGCHDPEALQEDLRYQQRWLVDVGVTPRPSLNDGRPSPPDIADVAQAVAALTATVTRHSVFTEWDEAARRTAVRETLARAADAPPHSDERADQLLALLPDEDAPRWTDQRDIDLALRETLNHVESDPLLTAHGLVTLLSAPHHVRVAEVRTALDTLTSDSNVGPHTMSWALVAYEALAVGDELGDFSYGWFLGLLRHPEPQVRETAITIIGELPRSAEEEADAVGELVRVLAEEEERDTTRAAAAHALGAFLPTDPAQTRVIGRALGDHAWDLVPEIRVEYLRYVLSRHDDSALPDLLEELAQSDVSAAYLNLVHELRCAPVTRCEEREWWNHIDHVDHFVQARQALEHLTALADQGWPGLPDRHHTTEERADILDLATVTLKHALGEPA